MLFYEVFDEIQNDGRTVGMNDNKKLRYEVSHC